MRQVTRVMPPGNLGLFGLFGLFGLAVGLAGACADSKSRDRMDGSAQDAGGQDAAVDLGGDVADDAGVDKVGDTGGDKAADRPPDMASPGAWMLGGVSVIGGEGDASVSAGGIGTSAVGLPTLAFGGWFSGTVDFDPGDSKLEITAEGSRDGFVFVIDPTGVASAGVGIIGGAGAARVTGLGLLEDGRGILAGEFDGDADLDPSDGVISKTAAGGTDAYLAGVNMEGGSDFIDVYGGGGDDVSTTVTAAIGLRVIVGGAFSGTVDFDPGAGTDEHTSNGGKDAFVVIFDTVATTRQVFTFGGTGDDEVTAVAAGLDGSLVVGGVFEDTVDFGLGMGAMEKTAAGGRDAFILRLSFEGAVVDRWTVGGPGDDAITCAAAGLDGSTTLAGTFQGTVDLDPGAGTTMATGDEAGDAFLLIVDAEGKVGWVRHLASASPLTVRTVTGASPADLFVGGSFEGTVDFDPGSGTSMKTATGKDGFVARFNMLGNFTGVAVLGGAGGAEVVGIGGTLAAPDVVNVLGEFDGTVDMDPEAGTEERTAGGAQDVFLIELKAPMP